jgi:hypothetical protein
VHLTGESGKDVLGDIGRAMEIAPCAAQRGAVYEIDVLLHQCGEGLFAAFLDVRAEQCSVIVHGIHPVYHRGGVSSL